VRRDEVRFAHESERRLAELFDFYRLAWEYEPVAFALSWGPDGAVTMAFRPDFYLPDLDLFIELTTLRQELVTRKNRKVRRLRELHPGINLKILYRRDYNNLLFKADPLAVVLSMETPPAFEVARPA
jgi:hypoxanthine phosphoribosyltransferase